MDVLTLEAALEKARDGAGVLDDGLNAFTIEAIFTAGDATDLGLASTFCSPGRGVAPLSSAKGGNEKPCSFFMIIDAAFLKFIFLFGSELVPKYLSNVQSPCRTFNKIQLPQIPLLAIFFLNCL